MANIDQPSLDRVREIAVGGYDGSRAPYFRFLLRIFQANEAIHLPGFGELTLTLSIDWPHHFIAHGQIPL